MNCKEKKRILIFANKECDNYALRCRSVGLEPTVSSSLDGLSSYDGVIFVGGGDIDPVRYGEENTASVNIEDEFDEKCFLCADYFNKNNKAMMGICKGMQLLNVFFGGTLIQDVGAHKHTGVTHAHKVHCEKESPLFEAYGKISEVNSTHHQCVGKLAEGLDLWARAEDGVIEAFGSERVIGVQWHPEKLLGNGCDTTEGIKIFEIFKNML